MLTICFFVFFSTDEAFVDNLGPGYKGGETFFSIIPDLDAGKAVFTETKPKQEPGHLKVL